MPPCHPFRPVPGQCGPNRRGPLPAPPFDPNDYWATKKFVSSLFGSLETRLDNLDEFYKVDVVDPGAATEAGQAADAKKTREELNRILGVASNAQATAESKADKATTLAGYGITDAATKAELAAKADLADGKVPAAQLPSYVDDVLEYDTMSAFPATGESGKIYVAKDANKTYRWSGTQYVEISPLPVLDDTVTETSSNGVKSSGIWSWVKSLLPHWLTSDYAEPATVESVANKRDKDDLAVYDVVRTENTDWTWTSENTEFAHDLNEAGTKPEWNGHAWWYVNLPSNYSMNMPVETDRSVTSITYDVYKIAEIPVLARCTATRPRYMDETLGSAKTNQQLAAVATDDASKPENGDLVKYDTANDRFVKAIAGTDYIPLIKDSNDEKTAVTIGSRISGKSVGKYSLANGYNVTASGYASHAEGDGTTATGNSSHAEGVSTTASGSYSHAEGTNTLTRADDRYAYAWNGDENRVDRYSSHGQGTFNINPKDGLDGFYIGDQTLTQVINAVIAERLSTIDPDNASVYDLIKALKGE